MPKKTRTSQRRQARGQERCQTDKHVDKVGEAVEHHDWGSAPSPAARVLRARRARAASRRTTARAMSAPPPRHQGPRPGRVHYAGRTSPFTSNGHCPCKTSRAPRGRRALRRQVRDQGAGQRRRRRPRARGRTPLRAPPASPASPAKSDPRTGRGAARRRRSRAGSRRATWTTTTRRIWRWSPTSTPLMCPTLWCAGVQGAGSRRPSTWSLVRPVRSTHGTPCSKCQPCRTKVKIHKVTLRRKRSIGPFPQNSA